MIKKFTLILVLLFLLLFSCQKIDKDDISPPIQKLIDTITLVYQEFHIQSLISKFDTQSVYIENNEEFLKIYGEWDTTIVLRLTTPPSVEILSNFKDIKCSNPILEPELYEFGQLYKSQCWTETNGIPWFDFGVRKIISTKYGVIFNRGSFVNSGHVLSSIDGAIIPEDIKKKLIKME